MGKSGVAQRYGFFITLAVCLGVTVYAPSWGVKVFAVAFWNTIFMLGVTPPIFILVGLFDVWIPRERAIKRLGDASRWLGIMVAIALGAFAAGPLYAAFPVAEILLKKGVSLGNVWVFLGTWSTMKIPMLLFEVQAWGCALPSPVMPYHLWGSGDCFSSGTPDFPRRTKRDSGSL